MSRARRITLWAVTFVALVVLLVTGVVVWTVRRSFPETSGDFPLAGLDAEVRILRDEWGVPHVYASTTHDLFLAQAFVHSQDRFWQMDVRRHVTAGRVAELFGEDEIDTDRFLRTIGWRRTAEAELGLLAPGTLQALDAYAEGVNAYLGRRGSLGAGAETSRLSLEYAVLGLQRPGYTPEPWEPADTVAWLKAMAWDLRGNMEDEIDRALLAAAGLGVERVEGLYPDYPFDRSPTIVAGGTVVDGRFVPQQGQTAMPVTSAPAAETLAPDVAASLRGLSAALQGLPAALGPGGSGADLGSNSWVVSGSRSATGMPILANDPHLGPEMPSLWYRMGLHCEIVSPACPYDVVGYTFAGVPGVIIGHNHRIAWGFTNLAHDVTDLYVERVDGDRYEVDGQWRDMSVFTETIEVAGGDPVEHTVRLTEHGPLLSDVSGQIEDVAEAGVPPDDGPSHGVALRWTALDPGTTADAILLLNRARNFDDFRAAAALFEVPAQNLLYADVDGNIGYQAPGRVPIRSGYDGRWPVAGWDGANAWTGEVPFEQLPYELNPERGFIATANQRPVGPDYQPFLSSDFDLGYRAARINEMIGNGDAPFTVEDLAAMQMDGANLNARELVPHLLGVQTDAEEARGLLADWDLQQDADSGAAAFFQATWRQLLSLTFDELPEDRAPTGSERWYEVVRGLLERPDDPWWDRQGTAATEGRDEMLAAAMDAADRELRERLGDDPSAWRWGDLHTLTLTHGTLGQSGIAAVERLFNRGPVSTSGGTDQVNATGWNAAEGYEVVAVPSMRMVIDLSDLDASRWIDLTGASGHAYHAHYGDLVDLWRTGGMTPMRMDRDTIESETVDQLILRPPTG